ncbi:MAG: DUF2975 domain-containing protein [Oscillospiraceae bacterium]|jgi:hypothetical protein|nr:DUF2975 domain-containing protein [Oscillospiraceae bacterium]
MSSKALCALVRVAALAAGICGLALCGYVFPFWLTEIIGFTPGLIEGVICLGFLWVAAIPCFVILLYVWKVSTAIWRDEVFTLKTAKWIKNSAILLLCDAAFFFLGNIYLLFIGLNRVEILILSVLASIFGVSLALLAAVLSRYITKAATLQEDSEGTI